ncbi:hypothetical protein GALMADRAFT_147375 [Galerina marginata CBS 339.88]|uniref:Uncharacterized protein n=1 Tax=Galerina marginata (strain CBS 339.88) TaxID=685588 RepID=A0A067SHG4_GALM3|nr:hypothetical protein GALMADRAFT_147375 [Galerina marginata CBS 339.88]
MPTPMLNELETPGPRDAAEKEEQAQKTGSEPGWRRRWRARGRDGAIIANTRMVSPICSTLDDSAMGPAGNGAVVLDADADGGDDDATIYYAGDDEPSNDDFTLFLSTQPHPHRSSKNTSSYPNLPPAPAPALKHAYDDRNTTTNVDVDMDADDDHGGEGEASGSAGDGAGIHTAGHSEDEPEAEDEGPPELKNAK